MPKRKAGALDADISVQPPYKRTRCPRDRLSVLSDELILRILHHVPVATLALCASVSRRLKPLASDSQIWREKYFSQFLEPRLRRHLRRRSYGSIATPEPSQPRRLHRWLDEGGLVQAGRRTDWKRQFKIRDNWSKGLCNLREIPLADPPIPALLGRLHAGLIVTADKERGLRVWSYTADRHLIAHCHFDTKAHPTALAVDTESSLGSHTRIAIGFEDGNLELHTFDRTALKFLYRSRLNASSGARIANIALVDRYLVLLTQTHRLALYNADGQSLALMSSLKSSTVCSPLSLNIRRQAEKVLVSIAFALPSISTGWCTSVQEIHYNSEGTFLDSRLATSEELPQMYHRGQIARTAQAQHFGKPTSLSYSHPYLLVSHADNTLTLYLVTSTANRLSVSVGNRLWGHTSSVLGAQVGGRGKAISVSNLGDEVRVWELESATLSRKKRDEDENLSIAVRPGLQIENSEGLNRLQNNTNTRSSLMALSHWRREQSVTKAWVGFDEEHVVVVREQAAARQALAVYDFT